MIVCLFFFFLRLYLRPKWAELISNFNGIQGKAEELRVSTDKRTCFFQYQRLKALHALVLENGGTCTGLQPNDLLDSDMIDSPSQWRKLQRELEFITDEVQGYGDEINDLGEDTLPQPKEPNPEMWGFADEVFKAMSCDCHAQFLRGSRLRIGTYHAVSKTVPKSLCILLEQLQDSEQWGIWHELLIRDHIELK